MMYKLGFPVSFGGSGYELRALCFAIRVPILLNKRTKPLTPCSQLKLIFSLLSYEAI